LLETILPKIFKDYLLLYSDTRYQRFRVFIWNIDEQDFAMDIETFHSKILLASSNVTSTKISLLVSDVLRGKDIFDGLQQMDELLEYYYSNEPKMAWYKEVRQQRYDELRITILINKLVIAIRSKNVAECKVILEQIQEKFANTYHSRMVGIRSCIDLYSTIYTILVPLLPEDGVNTYFIDLAKMIQNINQMLTLSELQTWLKQFEEQVIHQLEQMTEVNCEIIERVKSYILTHAKEKLMLQDIADYVNMSPSYLSALFKKQCNQNLVDYINEVKMNKACELIREGKYKIYEISYLLSFENAYYFTKVFKRYIGRTPKQYQNRVKGR
jgi:two-component system response regulator YesN